MAPEKLDYLYYDTHFYIYITYCRDVREPFTQIWT